MNIGDIARMAGVSKATVSRYLNNGYVSEEKKKRIGQAISETGFKPSGHARTLRTRKSGMVGIIIPKISSESVSKMVEGISSVLSKENYKILLANTFNDTKEEISYIRALYDYNVEGIILLGTILTNEHKDLIHSDTMPIVVLAQHIEEAPCVYYDDLEGAKSVAMEMMPSAKKIAYIGVSNADIAAGRKRAEGFMEACKLSKVPYDDIYFAEGGFDMESGYRCMGEILQNVPDIDSVFCATDALAFGALRKLSEAGKSIPDEVQIVGMGGNPFGEVLSPSLTTVHYSYKSGGEEAARLLLQLMAKVDDVQKEHMLSCQVVKRSSTRKI